MASVSQDWPYTFHWKNTPERAKLFGKRCRILTKGSGMRSLLVEFQDGEKVICSERALRRADG